MAENKWAPHKVIYMKEQKFHVALDDGLQIKDTQATSYRIPRSQLLSVLAWPNWLECKNDQRIQ